MEKVRIRKHLRDIGDWKYSILNKDNKVVFTTNNKHVLLQYILKRFNMYDVDFFKVMKE